MLTFVIVWVVLLLNPVSQGVSVTHEPEQMNAATIHEADMKDIDFNTVAVNLPRSERVRRLSPGLSRLCQAKEVRLKAKDFFRGRFSDLAIITPSTFRSVHCINNTARSPSLRGQHCLGVMNCKETRITKYFVVYDLAKAQKTGCLRGDIATIHNVPVECSCLWPLYLGKEPSEFLQRQRSP